MDALVANYWRFIDDDREDVTDEVAYLHDLSPLEKADLFFEFSKRDALDWLNEMGDVVTGDHDYSLDIGGLLTYYADDAEHVKGYQFGDAATIKESLIATFGNVYLFDWLYHENLSDLRHLMELCGFEWVEE